MKKYIILIIFFIYGSGKTAEESTSLLYSLANSMNTYAIWNSKIKLTDQILKELNKERTDIIKNSTTKDFSPQEIQRLEEIKQEKKQLKHRKAIYKKESEEYLSKGTLG